MSNKKQETMPDELRTMTSPPDVLHLDIGMTGQLHTYKLVKPKRSTAQRRLAEAQRRKAATDNFLSK